jgi:hypothetical protein
MVTSKTIYLVMLFHFELKRYLHLSKQLENSHTIQYLFMVQQPLVGQDLLYNRGFMITFRYTTLGRTPLDE